MPPRSQYLKCRQGLNIWYAVNVLIFQMLSRSQYFKCCQGLNIQDSVKVSMLKILHKSQYWKKYQYSIIIKSPLLTLWLRWHSQNTNDYSITVSQEFANEFWKKELTQVSFNTKPEHDEHDKMSLEADELRWTMTQRMMNMTIGSQASKLVGN